MYNTSIHRVSEVEVHKYLAHRANSGGWPQSLHDHLQAVAERAGEFAESFGAAKEAQFAGLLHDIGYPKPNWSATKQLVTFVALFAAGATWIGSFQVHIWRLIGELGGLTTGT